MKALLAQLKIENKLFVRSVDGLFWTLLFPVFFIVLFGLIYGETQWDDIRAIDYLLPGIIVMALMVTGIMYTTVAFVEERIKGIYRRLSLTPLTKQTILSAQLINRYLLILAQTALLLVVGFAVFKINIVGNWFLFFLVLSLGALCFLSIGLALTGFINSTGSANAISMIVFFMLMFLGGIFFPVEIMPEFLSYFANALPSTHLGDAFRAIIIYGQGLGDIWTNIAVVAGWMVAAFGVAIKTFKWE
ncbi:MAG: ABC transporter permease [Dehalococcoidaceae bacterium]|nr:ABC transporter permease [Dehalococcoidaceae bacterium]